MAQGHSGLGLQILFRKVRGTVWSEASFNPLSQHVGRRIGNVVLTLFRLTFFDSLDETSAATADKTRQQPYLVINGSK